MPSHPCLLKRFSVRSFVSLDNNTHFMKTDNAMLDCWLAQQPVSAFPPHGGIPYAKRYDSVASYLNAQVHPHVEKGAIVQGDGYLTDHGPLHIHTVIERAGELLSYPPDKYPQFSPYEIYLLLMATHFHDVGNLYGRQGHEQKLAPIMDHLGTIVGTESVERRAIMQIARAHAGTINGNSDTIDRLPIEDPVLGKDVRYQAIAAILRFADELADDSHRAARAMLALGQIPATSEVFHSYAQALHTVRVRPQNRIVELRFTLTKNDAMRKLGKGTTSVYLLDEIYERTLKMHCEREYCMRFTHGVVRIDAIDVRIDVFADPNSILPCIDPIGYSLRQRGYPSLSNIHELCPEIDIDGAALAQRLLK